MNTPFKIRTQLVIFSLFFTAMLVTVGGLGIDETRSQSQSMQSL